MTPGGTLTTLYTFCSNGLVCPDGQYPSNGALAQATNGAVSYTHLDVYKRQLQGNVLFLESRKNENVETVVRIDVDC